MLLLLLLPDEFLYGIRVHSSLIVALSISGVNVKRKMIIVVNDNRVTFHGVGTRGVFVRILHIKSEIACAKMSALCSFCVHHVTLNGRAVKSSCCFVRQGYENMR